MAAGHAYFCPEAKKMSRAKIADAMAVVDRRWRRLSLLAAELRGMGETLLAMQCEDAAKAHRRAFWGWAELLGVSVAATREDIRRLAIEVERAAENAAAR